MKNGLLDAMKLPAFYPHAPKSVGMVQTHVSWVFLAEGLVYKVKKPVNLGFLDFSDLKKRRFFCEEELRLNRRLAPDVYLKVAPIHLSASGRYNLEGDGRVAEYAVVMKRLPEEGMGDHLLVEGELTEEILDRTAQTLAAFHAAAPTGGEVDEAGSVAAIRRNNEENFALMERYVGPVLTRLQFRFLSAYAERFLARHAALFKKRVAAGRIRDGHGDLHLENLCIVDGRPVIFDCIEFSPRFRFGDVAGEAAFLCMDLDFAGAPDLARSFAESYARAAGDPDLFALLPFYKFYRACVRGKVLCLRTDDIALSDADRRTAWTRACCYFDFAFTYAARFEKPTLIIMCGLMGTGKSALARELAATTESRLLRSDVVRKEILGIAPTARRNDPYGEGAYDEETTARTYEALFREAALILRSGGSVILDASFKSSVERRKAVETAEAAGADFFAVVCECPETEVKRRLAARAQNGGDPSDGRVELFGIQKCRFEDVSDIPPKHCIRVTTTLTPRRLAQEVMAHIFHPSWF